MHSSTFLTSLALGFLAVCPLQAAPPNPVVTTAWPAGGPAGSTVSVTLTGSGIDKQIELRSSAPGLQAERVSTDKAGLFRITIPKTTAPGLYEIRLAGPAGLGGLAQDVPQGTLGLWRHHAFNLQFIRSVLIRSVSIGYLKILTRI